MLDAKNLTTLSGNLVADPEIKSDKVIVGTIAVSYAGTEDGKSATGFFDFTYYINNDLNSDFVIKQIKEGNMKKGSSISLVGKLNQDRFLTKEQTKASRVKVIAETIGYYGYASDNSKDRADTTVADAAHTADLPAAW